MGIRRIRWLLALLAIPTLTCHALDLNKRVTKVGTELWGVDELGGLKWALVVEYEDMNLNFTNNSYNKYGYDTNWTLDKVPDFDTRLVVEYEDINRNFTEEAAGNWTLSEAPDFNIKLVVEYVIKDASSQEWSMNIGPEVNSRLVVEYEDINLNFTEEATGNWTLSEAPDFNTRMLMEYDNTTSTIKLNGYGYATFSNAADVTVAGADVYTGRLKPGSVVLTKVSSEVPAYTGVILAGESNAEVKLTGGSEFAPLGDNDLKPTTTAAGLATKEDALVLSGKKFVTYTGAEFAAGKAYIPYTGAGSNTLSIVFEDVATAIAGVESDDTHSAAPVKVVTSKGVRIGNYSLTGQKVR